MGSARRQKTKQNTGCPSVVGKWAARAFCRQVPTANSRSGKKVGYLPSPKAQAVLWLALWRAPKDGAGHLSPCARSEDARGGVALGRQGADVKV